jgi:hypothetical protein
MNIKSTGMVHIWVILRTRLDGQPAICFFVIKIFQINQLRDYINFQIFSKVVHQDKTFNLLRCALCIFHITYYSTLTVGPNF